MWTGFNKLNKKGEWRRAGERWRQEAGELRNILMAFATLDTETILRDSISHPYPQILS